MKRFLRFLLVAVIMTTFVNSYSAILQVPTVYTTIQAGINAALQGDTVLVDPGVYIENLDMAGQNIVLSSRFLTTGDPAYIASTIIDGSHTGRVITIHSGEDSTCQVIGFTIRNGNSTNAVNVTYGGGVSILHSSPKIRNCVITNNTAPANGGGLSIYGFSAAPHVSDCVIKDNIAGSFGGGVFMGDCSLDAVISNSIISGNQITCNCDFSGGGGGVNLYHTGKLVNCLITGNSAPNAPVGGGGVHCDWGDVNGYQGIFVIGCTIADNTALNQGGVSYVINGGEFRNCIIWGNRDGSGNISNYDGNTFVYTCTTPLPSGPGNIGADPQFISASSGNYRLQSSSPCINAGNNTYNPSSVDLDGNPRLAGVIDMGAYEYGSIPVNTVQIGSGWNTSSYYPVNSCDTYSYTQQLYLAGEIDTSATASPGYISRIRFYYYGGSNYPEGWNNWTIYMGNTAKSEFTGNTDWIPVDSMTQVFSGTIPLPVSGNWLEINLQSPFYYTGQNLVVAVDENNPDWDCYAEWYSFDGGTARGLSFSSYSVNPDPMSPPMATSGPDYYIPQLQLDFSNNYGVLQGYVTREISCTDPVSGVVVSAGGYQAVSDSSGFYKLVLPAGTYTVVSASDNQVSVQVSPVYIQSMDTTNLNFCLPIYFPPPVQLEAQLNGLALNDAHLTWLEPGSVADQWIKWGEQTLAGSLGYGNNAITFTVASRWPVEDIAPYHGTYLKKVRIFPAEATANYTLKVWKGTNAATLVLSQPLTNLTIQSLNDIVLTTPVLIDGTEELWFGYQVSQTEGHPAGLAVGPAVAGKGDMFNGGSGWISIKNSWSFDYNWLIQGFISESPLPMLPAVPLVAGGHQSPEGAFSSPGMMKPGIMLNESFGPHKKPMESLHTNTSFNIPEPQLGVTTASLDFKGYNIYRDNIRIADTIQNLYFDDLSLSKGRYAYQVSAQYDLGESERIGPVVVDVYTCFPPENLMIIPDSLTTTSAKLTWTPSSLSGSTVWLIEWGLSGFLPGAGTKDTITGTPGYQISGLHPGWEYDIYLATLCTGNDSSAWVKKRFRTHYVECSSSYRLESELCGDTANNGCSMNPPTFEVLACGDTICGSAWVNYQSRDTDWYLFQLDQTYDVTINSLSDFPYMIGIRPASCTSGSFIVTGYYGQGYNNQLYAQLAPGSYYLYLAPSYNGNFSCDSLSRYRLSMACSSCLKPGGLSATTQGGSTATLTWTSNSPQWEIEWGSVGFYPGYGTTITGITQNTYTLTDLTQGYSYDYYVRSDCGNGEYSPWAGPYTFFIPCPADVLPYYEDFQGQSGGVAPLCWQVQGSGSPLNWIVDYYTNSAGGEIPELSFVPWANYFSGTSYFVSPTLNSTGWSDLTISFNHNLQLQSSWVSVKLMTTSDGGVTWNEVWSAANSTVQYEQLSLGVYNGDVGSANFQFAFVVIGSSWDIISWKIDNILVDGYHLTGSLQGVVTDCTTGLPIGGVQVTSGIENTYTDPAGYYYLSNISVGSNTVAFTRTGYDPLVVEGVQIVYETTTTLDTCLTLAGPPENLSLQNVTVNNGETFCYDALQHIVVAGGGTSFVMNNGSFANMIAGSSIHYLPGTWIKQGANLHAWIAPGGPFCGAPTMPALTGSDSEADQLMSKSNVPGIRVYPNPTTGIFTIEFENSPFVNQDASVEVFSMLGKLVYEGRIVTGSSTHVSITNQADGIYLVRILTTTGESRVFRIVKER